jgi:hypothetical protein
MKVYHGRDREEDREFHVFSYEKADGSISQGKNNLD